MARKEKVVLSPETCLSTERVRTAVEAATQAMEGKQISDIIDDQEHQYVDLVMEGGGVLGIALVGYTYLLESVGIRFLGIGGTSAGSINATLLAGLGSPVEAKSTKLLEALCAKDLYELVDGDSDARDFVDALVENKGTVTKSFKFLQVLDNLNHGLGLNPGDNFRLWISRLLGDAGVRTLGDLEKQLADLPEGLQTRDGKSLKGDKARARLAIVAADVTTETKVVFPEMAPLYFKNPEETSPADFVRASMSIPYFFEPYRRTDLPRSVDILEGWDVLAGIKFRSINDIPEEVFFVDGGIMSNFPIALFHDTSKVPAAPTFGARLGLSKRDNRVDGPIRLFAAIFNSARHCLDFDFIKNNPDFQNLVTEIPVDAFNWLDFRMPANQQQELFEIGVEAARDFLAGFKWDEYKEIRRQLIVKKKS